MYDNDDWSITFIPVLTSCLLLCVFFLAVNYYAVDEELNDLLIRHKSLVNEHEVLKTVYLDNVVQHITSGNSFSAPRDDFMLKAIEYKLNFKDLWWRSYQGQAPLEISVGNDLLKIKAEQYINYEVRDK